MSSRTQRRDSASCRRTAVWWIGAICIIAAGLGGSAGDARADFGLVPDSFTADVFQADGSLETRAGAHVDHATTGFAFNEVATSLGTAPDENVKTIEVDLPAGFAGNPQAVSACPRDDFNRISTGLVGCPPTSQVGIAELLVNVVGVSLPLVVPVFNVVPREGEVADFGVPVFQATIHLVPRVRVEGDNGLTIRVSNVSEAAGLLAQRLTLWGVPADPSHDQDRVCLDANTTQVVSSGVCSTTPYSVGVTPRPFLTNPTSCTGPVTSTLRVDSWQRPGQFRTYRYTTPVGADGCDRLPFEPRISMRNTVTTASAPTGLDVRLELPQLDNPTGLASAHLREAVVELPQGFQLNPSSAAGLTGCTDADARLNSPEPVGCTTTAKIGEATITTPLLRDTLSGPIFLGQPVAGKRYRIFMTAENKSRGIAIRLEGLLSLDSATGQITTRFENNPQLPFDRLDLHFKGGDRAALINPSVCGTPRARATFSAWSGTVVTTGATVDVTPRADDPTCGGQRFRPVVSAGSDSTRAGDSSPFRLSFERDDGEQRFRDVTVDLPEGLLARIAAVTLCPDVLMVAGGCAPESRVGTATVGAGAGPTPFFLRGSVYIGGAYRGAPYSLAIVVPAIAGPFDLGTVVVRAAIYVDRRTTALRIVSDPMPSILDGVPLQLRRIDVSIDRSGFTLNPTRCDRAAVAVTLGSVAGTLTRADVPFRVTDCGSLSYRPALTLRVGAMGRTRPRVTTPLSVTLRMPPSGTNSRSVEVTLPKSINARLEAVRRACTLAQFEAGTCARARLGTAVAVTPLLRDPLRGIVYFVRNPARRIPDVVVALRGAVDVDLVGKVTIPRDLTLRTTFDSVPDVPITRFRLDLRAGKNGIIGLVKGLCEPGASRRFVARAELLSQSGRKLRLSPRMRLAGCRRGRG